MLIWLIGCGVHGGPGDKVGDDAVWYRTFGGAVTDEAWGIDADGDLFVATSLGVPEVLPDVWLYRLSPAGDIVWEATWDGGGSDLAYIVEEVDGVVYVGGASFHGLDTADADALLLAFDAATGERLWETVWDGGVGYEEIDGIVVDGGRMWVSGWTTGAQTGTDALLAEVDPATGDVRWTEPIGGTGWDEANGHLAWDGTALYLCGLEDGVGYAVGGNAYVGAYAPDDGAELWRTVFDDDAGTWDDALGLTRDGDTLYVVGSAFEGLDARTALWRVDTDGTIVWDERWADGESARSAVVAGDTVWVGANASTAGDLDFALVPVATADGAVGAPIGWGGDGHEELHDFVVAGDRAWLVGQTGSVGAGGDDAVVVAVDLATGETP